MLKMLMNDDLKNKKKQSSGLLMQFPTSNPQLHWPEPFPQPSACRIREGVKLVIFLWRSKKCINQTFIFETKFSGIKGQGSFLEEFHPKSHHQKSTKTNHQFRGWKQKLPPQKKAMSWIGHFQLFPIFQDLRPPQKDMWGKVDFGWSHGCWKKSPSHSHKKFKWSLLGITPQKRKNQPTWTNRKSSMFFVSLPKSLMALQACHGWIQSHLANPIQMDRRKFRRKSKGGLEKTQTSWPTYQIFNHLQPIKLFIFSIVQTRPTTICLGIYGFFYNQNN